VAERVRAGGHHIPADTIKRRYSRSVRNFLELYVPVATTWQVYENSGDKAVLLAFNNGYFDTVLEDDDWERFLRSADDDDPNSSGS
jgi:predicted ABC-type ATPase